MCVCVRVQRKTKTYYIIEKNWKHHLNLNPTSRRLLDMWCVAKLYWTRVERFCFIASATVIVSGLDQSGTRWAVRAANMRPTARRNASEPGWLAVEPSEKYWVWNYRNIWASVKILYISVQVVAIIGYRFLGGISLYSVSCISLTRPPAILKWSSTILILTHIQYIVGNDWKCESHGRSTSHFQGGNTRKTKQNWQLHRPGTGSWWSKTKDGDQQASGRDVQQAFSNHGPHGEEDIGHGQKAQDQDGHTNNWQFPASLSQAQWQCYQGKEAQVAANRQ